MQTYSFDIFDTVLFRLLANPIDVFFIMRKKLFDCGNEEVERLSNAFHYIRVFSEFKARRMVHQDDVQFDDIYRVVQSDFNLPAESIQIIKEIELESEAACLVRNEWAYNYIGRIRESTDSVIFISDMYLPTDFIKNILKKTGLFEEGDRIYVSGDIGLTKSSGRLYRHVLKCENLEPEKLHHMGDNRYSDYFIPRSLGIEADLLGFGAAKNKAPRTELHLERLRYLISIMWAGMMTLRCRWT